MKMGGDRKIPDDETSSDIRYLWLRETHENSNYILLRIPVEIHLFERGLQGICMDPDRLAGELALAEHDLEGLLQAHLVRYIRPKLTPKPRIDYRQRTTRGLPRP